MSYLGSTPTTQSFLAGTDSFNGTGSATNFTLSRIVNSVNDIQVVVNNVVQYPPNYSVSGTTLTISPAPSAGTNNVYVRYLSTTLQSITVPGGSTVNGTFQVAQSTYLATSSGNVGVGTTSPDSLSNFKFVDVGSSGTNQGVVQANNGTVKVAIYANSNTGALATRTNHNLLLQTNATTALTIDTSQNVGIGTTSPGFRLEVKGPSATAGQLSIHDGTGDTTVSGNNAASLLFQTRDSSVRTIAEIDAVNTTTNGTGGAMVFQTRISDTLAERARIDSSGNLLVGRTNNPSGLSNSLYVTGAYSNTTPSGANVFVNTDGSFFRSTSSLKYKTEVQDYSRGLEDVAKLRAVFYKAKSGISTEQQFAGFIAEEIEAAGLTEFVQYAEDGSPDALSYGNMVALCIKAIQEQQAMIDTMKQEIAELKAKVGA